MRVLAAFLIGLAAFWFDASARADEYPVRPVTLIVAFTPGGPSDVLARIVGKKPGHQVMMAMQAALQNVARRSDMAAEEQPL